MSEDVTPAPENERQSRIDALVAARDQATDVASKLAQANQALTQRLELLEKRLLADSSAAPAPRSTSEKTESSGKPAEGVDASSISALVREAVNAAVAPITEKIAAGEAQGNLKRQHEKAFAIAATQNPELSDAESEFSRVMETLWQKRPDLAALPDAPIVLAGLTRGILTDQRRAEKLETERKTQVRTEQRRPDRHAQIDTPDARSAAADEAVKTATEKGVVGAGGSHAFADIFRSTLTRQLVNRKED